MPANVMSRETVRDFLATLLDTELTGASDPVEAVYNHKVGDFNQQSPVLVVASAGSERNRPRGGRGTARFETSFFLTIFSFVAYAIEGEDWDEQDAEDRLDLVEAGVANVLMDNRSQAQNGSAPWDSIEFEGRTDATQDVTVGGLAYRREVIDVVARVVQDG